jgi:nucleotide-binding universal stress UspA family protein
MPAKTILFPTDFSEHSKAALQHAASLARGNDAMLLIVHVKEPPETLASTGFAGYPINEDDTGLRQLLDQVSPTVRIYDKRLLSGEPAEEIVQLAEQEDVEMIVMGTHGRTGLTRLLMGSVAEAVVRRAQCPVLTVKQPREAKVTA